MSILRMPDAKTRTGYRSHASIYVLIGQGLFTEPVKIGARSVGWPEHEIEKLNRARSAGLSDDQIRELVTKMHADRAAEFGVPFVSTWRTSSDARKREATKRNTASTSSAR